MAILIKVRTNNLLNYVAQGKLIVQEVRRGLFAIAGKGRKVAQERIRSQFRVRTGRLRAQGRQIKASTSVKSHELKGRVGPLPHLTPIFEHGATLAHGRGFLHPRPIAGPATEAMRARAEEEIEKLIAKALK